MRKSTLVYTGAAIAATAVLVLAGGGIAYAADRLPVKIESTKACGTVTLTFTNPETNVSKTHGFRWNAVAGDTSTSVGARTGLVTVGPSATVKETIRFDEDEFSGTAAVTVAVAFGPDSDIQTRLDVYPVDTDCLPPATTTPTATPTPTAPPPATTTPPVTPPVAPSFVDLDCADFPLPDGRSDQNVLDADRSDPHGLDANNNDIACESVDGVVTPDGDDYSQLGADNIPAGIDTGRA